ncbi:hypothetical protein HPB50_011114 [Hyalomma asiaticum]|uniref:Uncharacterized protein n=1 Tax=Hyalomma asiaticum TaxID=266040 RepID=A0ACB7SE27_HYAAI|nr:hypothetical protein HPB50_011114 [Hyalomma asiaticum]
MDVLQVSPAVHRILMDLVAKDRERSMARDTEQSDPSEDAEGSSKARKRQCAAVHPVPCEDFSGSSETKKQRYAASEWTPGETKLLPDRYAVYFPLESRGRLMASLLLCENESCATTAIKATGWTYRNVGQPV